MCLYVPNFCHNDELSSTMSWVGCLQTDSELFYLICRKRTNPSQNFCYSHSLNFHVSGSTEFVSKQPTQLIIAAEIRHNIPLILLRTRRFLILQGTHLQKLFFVFRQLFLHQAPTQEPTRLLEFLQPNNEVITCFHEFCDYESTNFFHTIFGFLFKGSKVSFSLT